MSIFSMPIYHLEMKLFSEINLTLVTLLFPVPFKLKTDFTIFICEWFKSETLKEGLRSQFWSFLTYSTP